jgi:hypothetical protein
MGCYNARHPANIELATEGSSTEASDASISQLVVNAPEFFDKEMNGKLSGDRHWFSFVGSRSDLRLLNQSFFYISAIYHVYSMLTLKRPKIVFKALSISRLPIVVLTNPKTRIYQRYFTKDPRLLPTLCSTLV